MQKRPQQADFLPAIGFDNHFIPGCSLATLCSIFGNPKTTILGFGFSSDISMFGKSCPKMNFYKDIANLVDIEQMYKKVYPDFKENGGSSLAKVCWRLLGKKLCKAEQISNWERRPLRYS